MFKDFSINSFLKSLFLILVTIFIVTAIIIAFTINAASNTLSSLSENNPQTYINRLSFLKYCLLIEAVLFLVFIVPVFLSIIKKYTNLTSEKNVKEHKINEQQREIERQNKLINNLSNLYNNAIEYDKLKTDFFVNISHELKTPLSVILGAIQLIDQKNAAPTDRRKSSRHLKVTRQNCYRLVRLINNILDITKIDSGYLRVSMINYNIVYLIEEITQSVFPFAEQKSISLEFDTEFEEIITAVDIDKIERIILNLLSNSIKFTKPGGKISVNITKRNASVIISVKDTGLGIPSNMQNAIFERFKQVNSSLTREFEGSGIGLSLVKSFVELHNGSIEVKSEENKGSEFVIELPIVLCESNIEDMTNTSDGQKRIIEAINIEFSDIYSIAS